MTMSSWRRTARPSGPGPREATSYGPFMVVSTMLLRAPQRNNDRLERDDSQQLSRCSKRAHHKRPQLVQRVPDPRGGHLEIAWTGRAPTDLVRPSGSLASPLAHARTNHLRQRILPVIVKLQTRAAAVSRWWWVRHMNPTLCFPPWGVGEAASLKHIWHRVPS